MLFLSLMINICLIDL